MDGKAFALRCATCGWAYRGKRRIKICRQSHIVQDGFHKRRVWCRGVMAQVVRKRPAKPHGVAAVDLEIEHAEARLAAAITKVKKATALIDRWQRRLGRLNRKRLAMVREPEEGDLRAITLED